MFNYFLVEKNNKLFIIHFPESLAPRSSLSSKETLAVLWKCIRARRSSHNIFSRIHIFKKKSYLFMKKFSRIHKKFFDKI